LLGRHKQKHTTYQQMCDFDKFAGICTTHHPVIYHVNTLNRWYVEIKCQLDATDGFFIADLIACSTCFRHHYAHHQELRVLYRWLLPVVFRAVKMEDVICKLNGICVFWVFWYHVLYTFALGYTSIFTAPNTTSSTHLYNTLELLMMGIMVPETCWASHKICNKETICCI